MPRNVLAFPSGSELVIAIRAAVGTDQDALCRSLAAGLANADDSAETTHLSTLLDGLTPMPFS